MPTSQASTKKQGRGDRSARLRSLLIVIIALVAVFYAVDRPWYLAWGTTDAERSMPLPGDSILPNAVNQETRGITIDAPPEKVWSWITQLGQDRTGFYSYDLLENAFGCEMPVSDRLDPNLQHWSLGDKLWMYPKDKAGGGAYATLRVLEPGRGLGFATRSTGTTLNEPEDGSWSFALAPVNSGSTRLLVRGRGAPGRSLLGAAFDHSIFEPAHFVMERRMMRGIEQLAETGQRNRVRNHIEVVIWTLTFLIVVASAIGVIFGRNWKRHLTTFAVSSIAFQLLTFLEPPLVMSAFVLVVIALLFWRSRHSKVVKGA